MATPSLCRVLLLAAALLIPTLPASGQQSQSDLRRENERLRARADDLAREIAAMRKEIEALKQENAQLRAALAAGTRPAAAPPSGPGVTQGPATLDPADITIDESKPYSSPRWLLKALTASYAEAMADYEVGSTADAHRIYQRHVSRWAARMNRTHRAGIDWHVTVVDPPVEERRAYRMRVQAVDPKTHVPLGDPFVVRAPRNTVHRLQGFEERNQLGDGVLVLRGTLVADIRLNGDRLEIGVFDNPRFIGPFAELAFAVEAQSLLPAGLKEEDAKAGATSPGGTGSKGAAPKETKTTGAGGGR